MRKSNYDKQPATPVEGCIWQGWQAIRSELQQACQQDGTKVLVIECYQGVYHDEIRQGLSGLGAHWIESQLAFKSVEEIEKMTFPYVTDDRLFGFRAHFSYEDFFDAEKVKQVREEIAQAEGLVIVYGHFASPFPKLQQRQGVFLQFLGAYV